MKMLLRSLLLLLNLFYVTTGYTSSAGNGVITGVNIQSRSIEINKIAYTLADPLVTLSPKSALISQLQLMPGQNIEYWTTEQKISKIKITKGYDDSKSIKK